MPRQKLSEDQAAVQARNLRRFREELAAAAGRKVTQSEVEQMAGITNLARYERGGKMDYPNAISIARVYGRQVEDFLAEDPGPPDEEAMLRSLRGAEKLRQLFRVGTKDRVLALVAPEGRAHIPKESLREVERLMSELFDLVYGKAKKGETKRYVTGEGFYYDEAPPSDKGQKTQRPKREELSSAHRGSSPSRD